MRISLAMAAALAALTVVGAVSSPASACKWKRAGYRAAAAGEVHGYKHRRHAWKHARRHAYREAAK